MHGVSANSNPFRADEAGESLPDGKHAPTEQRGRPIRFLQFGSSQSG
jgi:hypothetical protein